MSDGNGDYLSLHGDISGGTWSARNIHLISEKKTSSPSSGDYFAEAKDSEGNVLYRIHFTPEHVNLSSGDSFETYAIVIPENPEITEILLKDEGSGKVVYEYFFDPDKKPIVQLLEYPSGNFTGDFILSWSSSANSEFFYNLLYSYDGGSPGTWLGLSHSKDIRESEALKYSINSESMRGSLSSTKIRIIATDGINYAIDTSDSFYVSMKPPTIQLFLPTGDQPYYTQGNRYSGYQWDVRVEGIDGEHIPEDSYVWRSDVDGVVGRGDVYYGDNLSLGRHKLSFEVTALDGQLYTKDNIAEIIVVNSKPEIIVRVGDDTTVDLACNELELSVNFSNVPVKEVRYSFNARRGDASKIIDRIEQLPIRYHMEDDTRVRITASNFAKLYSRYDNVVKFRDCDP